MDVLVVAPVKVVQPVGRVVRSVRVHDVEQDGQAEAVRRVDQLFELFRRACRVESKSLRVSAGVRVDRRKERKGREADGP